MPLKRCGAVDGKIIYASGTMGAGFGEETESGFMDDKSYTNLCYTAIARPEVRSEPIQLGF